jgi:ABC-type multidrug transport system fused ATPase/permease subunit
MEVQLTLWYGGPEMAQLPVTEHLFSGVVRPLKRQLKFFNFCWSGCNSVLERDIAAQKLAEELRRQKDVNPDAERVIIAHSHGGNIAMRALGLDPGITNRRIRLITLATPFMQLYEAPPERSVFWEYAPTVVVFLMSLFILAYVLHFQFAFVVSCLLGWVIWRIYDFLRDLLQDRADSFRVPLLASCSRHPPNPAEFADILVLRGIDDEASLALSLGSVITRFTNILVGRVNRVTFWSMITALIVAIPYVLADFMIIPHQLSEISFRSSLFIVIIVSIVSGLACLGLLLTPLAKGVFGRELLWGSSRLDIAVNSTPDVIGAVEVRTLQESVAAEGKLRHGLYEYFTCMAMIFRWLVRDHNASTDFDRMESGFTELRREIVRSALSKERGDV